MSPRHSGQQTWITVEVAYASAEKQRIISLEVPQGTTALEAAQQSGIKEEFGSIDFVADSMGIFSEILDGKQRPRPEEYVLQDGDRVEIYRPLLIDPKSARVKKAIKAKKGADQQGRNSK